MAWRRPCGATAAPVARLPDHGACPPFTRGDEEAIANSGRKTAVFGKALATVALFSAGVAWETLMKTALLSACILVACNATASLAQSRVVCTLVVAADTGKPLLEEGDCDRRMSPASTFKITISLMGFDSGILQSPDKPVLPFKKGYADFLPEWRQPQTPASWMRDSVIWYSQQTTLRLGAEKYASYVKAFDYGNQDVSGDPGQNNGLTRAWLSSSLQISPREEVGFIRKLVGHALPVSDTAVSNTSAILDQGMKGDWHVYGKTGSGGVKGRDGKLTRPFGWFVGWATRGHETVVFARLIQADEGRAMGVGPKARDGLMSSVFLAKGVLK
jgi:beta-lactamase class D